MTAAGGWLDDNFFLMSVLPLFYLPREGGEGRGSGGGGVAGSSSRKHGFTLLGLQMDWLQLGLV